MLRVRAGRVYPVTAPPLDDGAVLVDAGRIAAVGPHANVPTPPGAELLEFPDAVLVPGLVNCHTHLELTHLAGRNTEREFARWIRRVRELKDASAPEEFRRSAQAGLRECWARGVTCVADTGSTGAALEVLHALDGRGIAYHEVFGPDPTRVHGYLAELERQLVHLGPLATGNVKLGVSPHAPYTVSAPLYQAVAELARAEQLPLAVHLAESREELELVRHGAGPFADVLRARGISVQAHGCSPVQYLVRLAVVHRASAVLCIHCVQADPEDVRALAEAGATVAHCPRSNRAHGHGTAPLAAFRAAGVALGLGTDSVVSVGDLDLRAEAGAAGLDGEEAVRMLTIEGARALGWEGEIGSLEAGKSADLAVFASPDIDHPDPPATALLTVLAGRIVYRG